MSQIIIGYTTEGPTDDRFLSSVILRTFVEVGFECRQEVEVMEPIIYIEKSKGDSFFQQIVGSSNEAFSKGVMAFCVHVDADSESDMIVVNTRINPLLSEIKFSNEYLCKNIVPIIPVRMTESWMLADKKLLKEEIGTEMSDDELGINRAPENVADPKELISEAIRIARLAIVKRRRRDLTISELYQPIGQKISLDMLEKLSSYSKFKEAVRDAYRNLNYLH